MKHLKFLAVTLLFLIASCGAPAESTTSNNYPPIVDTPLSEQESSISRTINNLDEESSPSLNTISYLEQEQREMAPEIEDVPACVNLTAGVAQCAQALENCRTVQGYSRGVPRTICVVTVQGKLIEVNTARAFLRMQNAARTVGVTLTLNSGFRTMDQQRYLYDLYRRGVGNLAAYPGFSNHQSGIALDLGTAANTWLLNNAAFFGFRRTVPSEDWHWEWNGTVYFVGSSSFPPAQQCHSATLARFVPTDTCVQARSDRQWYTCANDGVWERARSQIWVLGIPRCAAMSYPLTVINPERIPTTCYSTTLARDVNVGSCVRSRSDQQTYTCLRTGEFTTGWVRTICRAIN